jgi:hypothetical protein
MVINSHATSLEAASPNEKGWEVRGIWRTTSEKTDENLSGTEFTAQAQSYNLVYEHANQDLETIAVTDPNYNRTKLRGQRYWAENPKLFHTLIGNAIVTTVVLDETPAGENANKVQVSIDGVRKAYTTDYTVSAATKTVTFVAAPAADAVVVIGYEYLASC